MHDFSNQIKNLGVIGSSEGLSLDEIKTRIKGIMKLIPYLKLAFKDKLATRDSNTNDYNNLFTLN